MAKTNNAIKDVAFDGVFEKLYACKNSVRFKPADEHASGITGAIYLMNSTYEALGEPDSIVVKVSAVN